MSPTRTIQCRKVNTSINGERAIKAPLALQVGLPFGTVISEEGAMVPQARSLVPPVSQPEGPVSRRGSTVAQGRWASRPQEGKLRSLLVVRRPCLARRDSRLGQRTAPGRRGEPAVPQ